MEGYCRGVLWEGCFVFEMFFECLERDEIMFIVAKGLDVVFEKLIGDVGFAGQRASDFVI